MKKPTTLRDLEIACTRHAELVSRGEVRRAGAIWHLVYRLHGRPLGEGRGRLMWEAYGTWTTTN